MQTPAESSSPEHRVRFGLYLAKRLKRAGLATEAKSVADATAAVKKTARDHDDAEEPVQDGLADRDGADDDLDDTAQDSRANLAGRSADAVKKEPYIRIFDKGIGYYTSAPLDQEVARYTEFRERLEQYLPPTDEVRKKAVPRIDTGLKEFTAATKVIEKTRTDAALAATRLQSATEAWEILMEKTYGNLIASLGKAKAERFFPAPGAAPAAAATKAVAP